MVVSIMIPCLFPRLMFVLLRRGRHSKLLASEALTKLYVKFIAM